MTQTAIMAALGVLVLVAAAAFFFIGRGAGRTAERRLQAAAKATAEESAKRILDEAQRDAESLRKSAVVAGKEETIRLREQWEQDATKRREELERGERRLQERETGLDR